MPKPPRDRSHLRLVLSREDPPPSDGEETPWQERPPEWFDPFPLTETRAGEEALPVRKFLIVPILPSACGRMLGPSEARGPVILSPDQRRCLRCRPAPLGLELPLLPVIPALWQRPGREAG